MDSLATMMFQVKSVLDPCGDENDDSQDDEVSLGGFSMQRDDYSESDSEVKRPHFTETSLSLHWKLLKYFSAVECPYLFYVFSG